MLEKGYYQNKYRIDSARLPHWDYSADGYYFITICTKDRVNYFGEVAHERVNLSECGRIIDEYWQEIPRHFFAVYLDKFIVMPDHMHGIIIINKNKKINDASPFIGFQDISGKDGAMPEKPILTNRSGRDGAMPEKPILTNRSGRDGAMPEKSISTNRSGRDGAMPRLYNGTKKIVLPIPGSLPVIVGSFKSITAKLIHQCNPDFNWQTRYYDRIIKNETELFNVRQYIKNNPLNWEIDRNNQD